MHGTLPLTLMNLMLIIYVSNVFKDAFFHLFVLMTLCIAEFLTFCDYIPSVKINPPVIRLNVSSLLLVEWVRPLDQGKIIHCQVKYSTVCPSLIMPYA